MTGRTAVLDQPFLTIVRVGFYVFPPGSRRGASTEVDIAQWYDVVTGFPPFTPWVTPPPTVPNWLPVGLMVAAVFAAASVGLFLRHRRRLSYRVPSASVTRHRR